MANGIVYLVGSGPGDPGLVTLRAREIIGLAEVIVYDRLIAEGALSWARPDAELIYVGKLPDRHTLRQEEINQLLVQKAAEGRVVCRLKGGDPFVFGRGGEEALALLEAGLPFEVVPGVTAGIGGSAYAGIPVTHRSVATSVAFVTGHEDPTKAESGINWAGLATGTDTLVFYMGVSNLPLIVARLIEHGRPADTPAAVIERGTTPAQRVVTAPLHEIASRVEQADIRAPALILVGQVAGLREQLGWFDSRPLFGRRVLVTRTREQASALSERLRRLGAVPLELPLIEVQALDAYEALDAALDDMARFDWLVFTSANGVAAVRERLRARGLDTRDLRGPRVAAIGPGTAEPLEQIGVRVDLIPERFIAESLADGLEAQGMAGSRVLIARAEEAREVLPERLAAAGAEVIVAPCYRTAPRAGAGEELQVLLSEGRIDVATFASSSAVEAFAACVAPEGIGDALGGVAIACIGPVTAQTAEAHGLRVDVLPEEHTIPALIEALVAYCRGRD
ncbi:MAG: uroporphyrinogen-III C-methyltransferase [Armatimonadetes bacterium]|nr:uroporphyrinogen-III C-methyltransferase [Armatimonadota bacterium]